MFPPLAGALAKDHIEGACINRARLYVGGVWRRNDICKVCRIYVWCHTLPVSSVIGTSTVGEHIVVRFDLVKGSSAAEL
jgi:hypothetical protein